jgi:hypothetical protein
VAVGVGVTSLALLVTVLTAKGWSEENGVPGPGATWGAPSGQSVHPGAVSPPSSSSGGSPSAASAEEPVPIAQGRLRNLDRGLCLDLHDGEVRSGARAELAECSSVASQQWSYQDDGLLRSAAVPTLCLDSESGTGTVALANCLAHAGEVSYDLTVHGELLLRRSGGLAVAGGKGESVVVTERDGSEAQRWLLDGGLADVRKAEPGEKEAKRDEKGEGGTLVEPEPESPDADAPRPPEADSPEEDPEPQYETRYVQDDLGSDSDSDAGPDSDSGSHSGGQAEPATPVDAVVTLPAVEAPAAVSGVVGTATTTAGSALP